MNRLQVAFHAVGAFFFHLVGDMTVYIQGEAGGGVTEIALQRLNVITGTERGNGEAVPVGYNCDNTDKSSNIKGLRISDLIDKHHLRDLFPPVDFDLPEKPSLRERLDKAKQQVQSERPLYAPEKGNRGGDAR